MLSTMSNSEESQVENTNENVEEVQHAIANSSKSDGTDNALSDTGILQAVADLSIDEKPNANGLPKLSREERYAAQVEADSRSIFVGNITPEITPEIIDEHFKDCGVIERITLLYDKNTGAPKGYAYVEFENADAQEKALEHNGSELKGGKISVYKKRTNLPGYHRHAQFQRPNFYFQQQYYYYPQGGYQDYKNMNIYAPPFELQSSGPRQFGQFNGNFKGKYRGNYRNSKRGGRQQRNYSNYNQLDDYRKDDPENASSSEEVFNADPSKNNDEINGKGN